MEKTLITIEFRSKGNLLLTVWSEVYPHYNPGETITLETVPTNRERTRRPAQEWTHTHYKIEKVHHKVRQSAMDGEVFIPIMEVYLVEE